jgi:hypothetical protein
MRPDEPLIVRLIHKSAKRIHLTLERVVGQFEKFGPGVGPDLPFGSYLLEGRLLGPGRNPV